MLRRTRLWFVLLLAIAIPCSAADANWTNLQKLHPGQHILVVDRHMKTVEGAFIASEADSLRLNVAGSDATMARTDVVRVSTGNGSRGKHALIGLAVGTAAGAAIGAAVSSHETFARSLAIASFTVTGAVLGTASGALVPAHTLVYRAAP